MMKGRVTLVGAGPGDPELITVKGLNAIKRADVILYDALSSEALLDYAPDNSIKIYVGKRCGKHSLKQPDINALIIQYARSHRYVVRLKGGDPFIFGRGHEEMLALRNNNIEVEVIPGISSVTSLPLLQSVPLTRRNLAESFWVMTGTTKNHEISSDIYQAAQSDATSVILMGMNKLEEIAAIYADAGKKDVPAMVISKGSTKHEAFAIGSIKTIVEEVRSLRLETPGIIVIGEVVGLHPTFLKQKVDALWA